MPTRPDETDSTSGTGRTETALRIGGQPLRSQPPKLRQISVFEISLRRHAHNALRRHDKINIGGTAAGASDRGLTIQRSDLASGRHVAARNPVFSPNPGSDSLKIGLGFPLWLGARRGDLARVTATL